MAQTLNDQMGTQDHDEMVKEDPEEVERIAEDATEPKVPQVNQPIDGKPTRLMVTFIVFMAFAAWISNFDLSYGGVVLAMPAYKKAFGSCSTVHNKAGQLVQQCSQTAVQQSLNGISSLFGALGGGFAGHVSQYCGRRGTIQVGCLLILAGASGALGTAGNYVAYLACKSISGTGIGMLLAAASSYAVECVTAQKRGTLMALFNVGIALGNVSVSAVCAGSATLTNSDWSWQIPILCQIPVSLVFGVGVLLFPESPRMLMTKGKESEARVAFARFYDREPDSDFVSALVDDVRYHIDVSRTIAATASWSDIFGRNNIRRTLVSSMVMVSLAICGIHFLGPYAALFFTQLGVSNAFIINLIIGVCILGGASFGPLILDYGGRRFALLWGYSGMSICMLIFSVVASTVGLDRPAGRNTMVAFFCLWSLLFGAFVGSSTWVASAEMHSVRLRGYGQGFSTGVYQVFSFANTFWTPYMINAQYGNMGTNVGYFYAGVTVMLVLVIFFTLPETAFLTLEEIEDYWTSGTPAWKTSTKKNKIIVGQRFQGAGAIQ